MAPGSRDEADHDPLRRAAQYRVDREADTERAEAADSPGQAAGGAPDGAGTGGSDDANGPSEPRTVAGMSVEERSRLVDVTIDQAMRRGEFDNLPLHGKPIPGLRGTHDPDWWVKGLIERENITGVLPSAQLRAEHARMDDALDLEAMEARVREIVGEFNARVIDARRQLQGGPPIVTPTRDVDEEVRRWRERRAARRAASATPSSGSGESSGSAESSGGADGPAGTSGRRPWWRFW